MIYNSVTIQFDKNFSSSIPSISSTLEGELRNMPFLTSAFKSTIYVSFIYLDSQPPEAFHIYLYCTLLRFIISALERKK